MFLPLVTVSIVGVTGGKGQLGRVIVDTINAACKFEVVALGREVSILHQG